MKTFALVLLGIVVGTMFFVTVIDQPTVISNFIGDQLGFARCPVTGDTYCLGDNTVWYTPGKGLLVSPRAMCREDLAREVYEFVVRDNRVTPEETSIAKIKELNGF
jgi:hypothetical protein